MKEGDNLTHKTLDDLVAREKDPLYTLSTMFPFVLFPITVKIYRNKIIIEKTFMFISKYEFPILIDDLKTVTVTTAIWFASLLFEIKGFEPNPSLVPYLRSHEALEARRIIMGLMLLKRKKVSTENISTRDLIEEAKLLG